MTAKSWPSAILDVLQEMYEVEDASKADIAARMTELRGRPTSEHAVEKRATIIGLHRSAAYMRGVYSQNGTRAVPVAPREYSVVSSERAAIARLYEQPEVRENPVRRVDPQTFKYPGGYRLGLLR